MRMNRTLDISNPRLFGRKYLISDQGNIVAAIKYKGPLGNKAVANFNDSQWVIQPNFLNNKISMNLLGQEAARTYEFKTSLTTANSKGTIEFEGKEYSFKQLFGKWAGYTWSDSAGDEIITYSLTGLLTRKGKIVLSDKVVGGEKLMPVIVLGLYLMTYSFSASSH